MAKPPIEAHVQLVHEKGRAGDKLRPQPTTWFEVQLLGDGSPSLGPPPPRRWIEIEMRGEDDEPLGGLEYRLKLPNGRVREGVLDDDGRARVEGFFDEGDCEVSFPELDQDAWEFVESVDGEAGAPGPVHGDDFPVAGERYRVALPDGTVREGVLEPGGTARFEGLPRGPFTVSFPELDEEAWEAAEGQKADGGAAAGG